VAIGPEGVGSDLSAQDGAGCAPLPRTRLPLAPQGIGRRFARPVRQPIRIRSDGLPGRQWVLAVDRGAKPGRREKGEVPGGATAVRSRPRVPVVGQRSGGQSGQMLTAVTTVVGAGCPGQIRQGVTLLGLQVARFPVRNEDGLCRQQGAVSDQGDDEPACDEVSNHGLPGRTMPADDTTTAPETAAGDRTDRGDDRTSFRSGVRSFPVSIPLTAPQPERFPLGARARDRGRAPALPFMASLRPAGIL